MILGDNDSSTAINPTVGDDRISVEGSESETAIKTPPPHKEICLA